MQKVIYFLMELPVDNSQRAPRHPHRKPEQSNWLVRFAHEYGWWRVVAIPVMIVLTIWVIADVIDATTGTDGTQVAQTSQSPQPEPSEKLGPDPADAGDIKAAKDQLPAGGDFTEAGDDTYRDAGPAGAHAGKGGKTVVRYSVEIENGVNTIAYGGDSAFAAMVDATLGDPRGWTSTGDFEFIHVAADDKPDTRIRLTSLATTAKLCGAQLNTETSCHTGITGESTVNLNESRWVRGAVPFEGDLGNYRQYLINHEFGHAIGYASHQACGGEGKLAPVMMQQTLSLNNAELYRKDSKEIYPDEDVTCEPNPWPYPNPRIKDPHNPE
ncbi:DUF3152 domain-containing protein [Corynebacterium striatum]|uniref:DUF3152 domain-containing protein n=2 Tax=Corynebacterium striatum TaxID=43770 RepID=A0ABC9ZR30_CORST|nr:hypothetical protein HMPREF0308_1804 [Corynebacterium striatum ATCC 6940]GEA44377.1 hypothetical protein Cst04h_25470 [Corynebacterium striatum]GKH16468.1 hypothetical protein CE91St29_07810 [Corynebacterium striatum]STD61481.1 putative secreted protein [Corynebacterium striatum]